MKRYLLKEDVPLQKLNVRLSSELIDKIEDINTSNYANKEELARWHDFLDGMISWISNPVVTWDNTNNMKLNWKEFGLWMSSTFVEGRNRIDRIITETLNKFILENILMENKQMNQKIKKH